MVLHLWNHIGGSQGDRWWQNSQLVMMTLINTPDKNSANSNESVTLHVIAYSLHEASFHHAYNLNHYAPKLIPALRNQHNMLECNWQSQPTGYTRAFHHMKSNILDTEINYQLVTLKLDNQITLNLQCTVLKYCCGITWIIKSPSPYPCMSNV